MRNGLETSDAYGICASIEEECNDICVNNTNGLLDKNNADESLFSSFPAGDSSSSYIDVSLLRPSIPEQLFGPKKTPARRIVSTIENEDDSLDANKNHTHIIHTSSMNDTNISKPKSPLKHKLVNTFKKKNSILSDQIKEKPVPRTSALSNDPHSYSSRYSAMGLDFPEQRPYQGFENIAQQNCQNGEEKPPSYQNTVTYPESSNFDKQIISRNDLEMLASGIYN